ncbi:MAG TPA: 50S ribosomal protein L9 [Candidatus Krumholzibacteria bacterium]|nr:50S ribosomal protein L9 [Candidatus Krumholzibacteria bacterium]
MEVILLDAIPKLGNRGELVKVKPGFARNYLFPRQLALPASEANRRVFQEKERLLIKRDMQAMESARAHAARLQGAACTITVQVGDEDKMYGSVTSIDIHRHLTEKGYEFERRQIVMDEPIKQLGEYSIDIRLHRDVSVPVKVSVVKE